MGKPIEVTEGSGNVFADLGLPRAHDLYVEALAEILEARCAGGAEMRMADPLRTDIESLANSLTAEEVVASNGARHVATLLAAKYLDSPPAVSGERS